MKRLVITVLMCCAVLYADDRTQLEVPPINPPAGPRVQDWSDFYLTGAFIWWIPRQEGLAYAQSGRTLTAGGTVSKGHEADISFDFSAGFKIGAGLNFRYDGWDIYANYTWLYPSTRHGSIHQGEETGGIQSQWLIPNTTGTDSLVAGLERASASWQMHFNVIDTELGRNFFVSPKLTLRPFIGFKGVWINQDYDVHYTLFQPQLLAAIDRIDLDMEQHFTGFGIRVGMNSAWKIGDWWSIFADFAFSELWCEYEVRRKDTTHPTVGEAFTSFHSGRDFHTLNPVIELDLGLRYTHDFKGGKWRVTLQGAWEEQVWFSFNQLLSPSFDGHGNLTIHGATARLGFAF